MAGTKRLSVFVDTGAWVALNLGRDSLHARAVAAYEALPATARLVTSSDVYDESMTRSRYDEGLEAADRLRRFLEKARRRGKLEIVSAGSSIYDAAWELLRRHADVKLSFTDAASAAIARSLRIKTIFGFDSDFRALGFDLIPA